MSRPGSIARVTAQLHKVERLQQEIRLLKRLRLSAKDRRDLLKTEKELKDVKADIRQLLSMLKRSKKK